MNYSDKINKFLRESIKATGKYFYSKMLTSFIIVVISYMIFKMLEIELPGVLATILGITNLIPIIGPWGGIIICAIIVVFQEPIFALYIALTAILLQLLEEFFLLPIIAGKALDLKPLLIVVAIICGSLLFGFWGIIFAVPIAAVVKIGYKIFLTEKDD